MVPPEKPNLSERAQMKKKFNGREPSISGTNLDFIETRKSKFGPVRKDKAKYIFYALERITKAYYWRAFKKNYNFMPIPFYSKISIRKI